MQYLGGFDSGITLILAHATPHTPFIQALFSLITLAGGSFVIWSLPFAARMMTGKKYDLRFIFYFILSFILASVLSNCILKNVFMRTRPYIMFDIYSPVCPLDFSFPSGHAAVSFAAAAILARYDRKRRHLYYVAAILVSYSRIFLYCHYLYDVVAGGLLGYIISRTILYFHDNYRLRNPPKTYPQSKK